MVTSLFVIFQMNYRPGIMGPTEKEDTFLMKKKKIMPDSFLSLQGGRIHISPMLYKNAYYSFVQLFNSHPFPEEKT